MFIGGGGCLGRARIVDQDRKRRGGGQGRDERDETNDHRESQVLSQRGVTGRRTEPHSVLARAVGNDYT